MQRSFITLGLLHKLWETVVGSHHSWTRTGMLSVMAISMDVEGPEWENMYSQTHAQTGQFQERGLTNSWRRNKTFNISHPSKSYQGKRRTATTTQQRSHLEMWSGRSCGSSTSRVLYGAEVEQYHRHKFDTCRKGTARRNHFAKAQ